MKRYLLLFVLLLNSQNIFAEYHDCSSFEEIKKEECLKIGVNKNEYQCYYSSNQCSQTDSKYTSCEGYTVASGDINRDICESINVSGKKCTVNNNQCVERDIVCEDLDEENCEDFNAEDGLRCLFINNKCYTHHKKCETIDDMDTCNSNFPDPLEYNTNKNSKCSWDTTSNPASCKESDRGCSEYNIIKDINLGITCSDLKPSVDTKKCVLDDGICIEQFAACEDYDGSDENVCKAIKPLKEDGIAIDPLKKCVYNSQGNPNKCTKTDKLCSDYISGKDDIYCNYFASSNPTLKMCILTKNGCEDVYQSCGKLNQETDTTKQNKGNCESIEVYITNSKVIDYSKNCTFESDSCGEKEKKCDGYKPGQSEEYCTNIVLTDNTKKCALIDGKCVEQPASCKDYKESDKKICESIKTGSDYTKCVLDKDETCTSKQKICSEYLGKNANECAKYKASDSSKICSLVNGKCIEQYQYCSDYSGNDQRTCESIIPYDDDEDTPAPLPGFKCVLDSKEGCIRKSKGCSEAKTFAECSLMVPSDTDIKTCIFYNNQCIEEFKSCNSYTENVVQGTCENIKLSDYTKKCEFSTDTCSGPKDKKCTDFKFESIGHLCESIVPSNIQKKCVFSNNVCSESNRNCLDLANQVGVTADICSSATTSDSNTKTCSLKEDKSGCEEVNKSSDQQSPSQGNNNNSNGSKNSKGETKKNQEETNDNNFAGEKSIPKLLLIMISLLF